MIRHVVMFTFKQGTTEEQVQAVLDGLASLPGQVPSIRDYKFGRDAGINQGNYDVVVTGDFDDDAGYVAYRDHPAHTTFVAEKLRPILDQRAAVQFAW